MLKSMKTEISVRERKQQVSIVRRSREEPTAVLLLDARYFELRAAVVKVFCVLTDSTPRSFWVYVIFLEQDEI